MVVREVVVKNSTSGGKGSKRSFPCLRPIGHIVLATILLQTKQHLFDNVVNNKLDVSVDDLVNNKLDVSVDDVVNNTPVTFTFPRSFPCHLHWSPSFAHDLFPVTFTGHLHFLTIFSLSLSP